MALRFALGVLMTQTRTERFATWVLESVGTRLWGFAPNLMPYIVARLGPWGALRWFAANMPQYERTLAALGPIPTHLLALEISIFNGCPYCIHGHASAFELHYLRTHDRLFPLDEAALVALAERAPDALRAALVDALEQAGLAAEVPRYDAVRAAWEGDETDPQLAHLVSMFAVLNACGVEGRVPPDEAHDPVNKDHALRARYRALRAAGPPAG